MKRLYIQIFFLFFLVVLVLTFIYAGVDAAPPPVTTPSMPPTILVPLYEIPSTQVVSKQNYYSDLLDQYPDLAGVLTIDSLDFARLYFTGDSRRADSTLAGSARYGAVYMDSACSIDPLSQNLILYGYDAGVVFGPLRAYMSPTFAAANRLIYLSTLYEQHIPYTVFAVCKSTVLDKHPLCASYDDLSAYVSGLRSSALYFDLPSDFSSMLTLVAYSYAHPRDEFVIFASRD